jgi:DNA repair exonuclease SbcCD ATPase subunit
MFSYGANNIIDFSQMSGTYGIFAPNASGKSSLWDALSFCIYDKCSRTSKAVDVLNYSKNSFDCKFNFEIEGVDYFIERIAKKSAKHGTVKVDVQFYRINDDGTTEYLNGDERRDTNSIIRQYVGSYDDFVLTAMSNQSNNSGFIEKSQKERKELLAQFLDMDVFEELYQVANEEIKELSALLKDYKNQNFTEKLSEAKDSLLENESVLSVVQSKLNTHRKTKEKITSQIELLILKLISVDSTIINIDKLHTLNKSLGSNLKSKITECEKYTDSLVLMLDELSKIESEFESYDLIDLKSKYVNFEKFTKIKDYLQEDLDTFRY